MKRIFIWLFACIVFIAVLYGLREYFRTNKDLSNEKPVASLPAQELIQRFEASFIASNRHYVNRVVAVTGMVTAVQAGDNPVVISLGEAGIISSIQCSMDSTHAETYAQVVKGQQVTIKGLCTGALQQELFGTDVKLVRCVVVRSPPE